MSQIEQAYEIIAAAPDGMTSAQLGVRMGMSPKRAASLASKACEYGALEAVSIAHANGGRHIVWKQPA